MAFIPKEIYTTILEHMPIPTVDILFLNGKGEILLAKRNNEPLEGVYYIPGGRVEKGERLLDAAHRKAKEELGIEIDISKLRFIGVYDDIFENSAFPGVSTHCIPTTYSYLLSREEEGEIQIGDTQHSDYRFFSEGDNELHPMVKLRLVNMAKN